MNHRILVWFRNDLRLHDHAPLYQAIKSGSEIIPVYCFDPRHFKTTPYGFPKTGPFRAQFLLESLADLRQSLRNLGSDLVIRHGLPEVEVPQLVESLSVKTVTFNREVTSEETTVEQALRDRLNRMDVNCERYWGATLYHPQNLPFPLQEIPDVFTQFRKRVEQSTSVDLALPAPKEIPPITEVDVGELPSLEDLGVSLPDVDKRAVFQFKGGETAGKARVQDYIWTQDRLKIYKETRNGMLNPQDASRFSPWLALGCLSPRYIYDEVLRYEDERIQNDSTYWLVFELLWRDYFRFICVKHGDRIFRVSGLRGLNYPWKRDRKLFDLWKDGETGYPLVDANMQELKTTGFMSNRGRQNVASFLTKNLGIDWQMGAEWFESMLIDYDVCSNWGNWNYTAGVGNDARGFRFFNIIKQSRDYDPQGEYVKHWLPQLRFIPKGKVHTPWDLKPVEQGRFQVKIGEDYPEPLVDLFRSAKANEVLYDKATGRNSRKNTKPKSRRR